MVSAISARRSRATAACILLAAAALALHATDAAAQNAQTPSLDDWHLTGTGGVLYSDGNYGTSINTDVLLGLSSLSLSDDDFKFTASIPYMRISGRGLVVFDASGNPIVINRRTNLPPSERTGWGDLTLSASYTVPSMILGGYEARLTGIAKVPTSPARQRLGTGEADFGMSLDVSRHFGAWTPFVTAGYMYRGEPLGFTIYDTTSVSAGTSLELRSDLVATASYDFDSADSPLVPAGHSLSASLSWIHDSHLTLTGYTTVGLSAGSPDVGAGLLLSYGLN
jgi:hypothetical protein